MKPIKISPRANNLKIISKLMDSVARQYDCRVRYDGMEHRLRFEGDPSARPRVIEQSAELISLEW
jgi:hypothetical protein